MVKFQDLPPQESVRLEGMSITTLRSLESRVLFQADGVAHSALVELSYGLYSEVMWSETCYFVNHAFPVNKTILTQM